MVANAEGGTTQLLRRNASGVFIDRSCDLHLLSIDGTPFTNCQVGRAVRGRQDYDVEAADGDGDLDLIFAVCRGGAKLLLFNDGTGVFSDVTATHWTLAPDDNRDIELADVDLDGDIDVLIARRDPQSHEPRPEHHLA